MYNYLKKFSKEAKKATENEFFVLLIFILIIISVLPAAKRILNTAKNLYVQRNISYEDKLLFSWASIYGVEKLADGLLDGDASVMYPPQNKEAWLGNGAIVQYFFHPRKIYAEDPSLIEEKKIDAIIVTPSWPDFFVPIRKAYFEETRSYTNIRNLAIKENGKIKQELMLLDKKLQLEPKYTSESILVNSHSVGTSPGEKNEQLDFTISETDTEIWLISVNIEPHSDTIIVGEIESGMPHLGSVVAEITYASGRSEIFKSERNKKTDQFENFSIIDIYKRAYNFGIMKGWGTRFKITGVGIEFGAILPGPFPNRGIGKIEKGENCGISEEGAERMFQQALCKYMNGDFEGVIKTLNAAKLLSNQDPKITLLLAKSHMVLGNTSKAIAHLKESIELKDIWSGVELINLTNTDNYRNHESFIKLITSTYPDNTYLNLAVGKLYHRLGIDLLAYKYYTKATANYPFSSSSVEAAHILNDVKNGRFSDTEADRSKREYLNGDFHNSYKIMKESSSMNLPNVYSSLDPENAFVIRENNYDSDFMEDNPSGFKGDGVYLGEKHKFSLKPLYFPPPMNRGLDKGTIEFYWKALNIGVLKDEDKSYYILDQEGSHGKLKPTMRVFVKERQVCFQVKDIDRLIPADILSCSEAIDWQEGRWYKLSISWDTQKIRYYLDKRMIDEKEFTGRVGIDPIIYFGLAADKFPGSVYNPSEFNVDGVIDSVILYNYPKRYSNGQEIWK